jgi:hypothetical protein
MPNGRSGSLFLNKTEFASWLSVRKSDEVIGRCPALPGPDRQVVSVEMVVELLGTYPADRIVVEEQDRASYIVHLYHPFTLSPPDPERWILIKPESPLFQELRRQHKQQGKWGAGSL